MSSVFVRAIGTSTTIARAAPKRTVTSACRQAQQSTRPQQLSRSAQTTRSPYTLSQRISFTTTPRTPAPIDDIKRNCRKVICIGRNYADHITELSSARPAQPFFFLKPPSSILTPSEGPILRPQGVDLHYEVELGLVLGKPLRDLDPDDTETWMNAVESYVLAIDMTARNVQDEAKKKGLPWSIAKGFDTFLPLAGPVGKSVVRDPHEVELWLSVNGAVRQRDSTALMLFRIGRQLSDISRVMSLGVGDVVLTGTPKGVGKVVAGDVIEAGMRVGGEEVREAGIRVEVQDRVGGYRFAET